MKILFGSNDFIGSNIMVQRFIQHAPHHDIRVAGYYRNHQYLNTIDWCLDALYQVRVGTENYFQKNHGISGPHINHNIADIVVNELVEWMPEMVISDCEPFTASIAKILEIPLFYCSSALQLVGIEHERKEIDLKLFSSLKSSILSLPKGDAYLVYSALCDVQPKPVLKNGFEWIRPYSKNVDDVIHTTEDIDLSLFSKALPENSFITTGETSFIADGIYAKKNIFVCPNPLEPEQILNAQLLDWYGCGTNIGRPKSLDFVKRVVERTKSKPVLSMQRCYQLDERIEHA